jgi:RNA polymerase sigma factor (TIGR02999 family)
LPETELQPSLSSANVEIMSNFAQLMTSAQSGDSAAAAQLLPLVYDQLRQIAAVQLAHEAPGQTLDATALVHEAYVRLVGVNDASQWQGRTHFVTVAAEAMRRILVDRARAKATQKRGGGRHRVPLDESHRIAESPEALLAFNDVLSRFSAEEPLKAELVKLRFFCGLTMPEAAAALGISLATAERWWAYARSWLFVALGEPR